MTIYNLGSINADHFYDVPHLPQPGETLAASGHRVGLGGKGANQSVAAAKAGRAVRHIGAVGADGRWAVERMTSYGVDTANIAEIDAPTAHAIINVDAQGENAIVIYSGANSRQSEECIENALKGAGQGDLLLLQNETSHQRFAAAIGRQKQVKVIYSAAPFDIASVVSVLPYIDLLVVNALEAEQLCVALDTTLDKIEVAEILVTRGAHGADWHNNQTGASCSVPSRPTRVVDTTGAGDTFLGYFAAGLDEGRSVHDAMTLGAVASANKIRSRGTADAIPDRSTVDAELGQI